MCRNLSFLHFPFRSSAYKKSKKKKKSAACTSILLHASPLEHTTSMKQKFLEYDCLCSPPPLLPSPSITPHPCSMITAFKTEGGELSPYRISFCIRGGGRAYHNRSLLPKTVAPRLVTVSPSLRSI